MYVNYDMNIQYVRKRFNMTPSYASQNKHVVNVSWSVLGYEIRWGEFNWAETFRSRGTFWDIGIFGRVLSLILPHLSRITNVARKTVFGVKGQARLEPAC